MDAERQILIAVARADLLLVAAGRWLWWIARGIVVALALWIAWRRGRR